MGVSVGGTVEAEARRHPMTLIAETSLAVDRKTPVGRGQEQKQAREHRTP